MSVLIDYTIEPLGRISAGRSGPVGNDREVHRVLPGGTIRGALGTAWWSSPTAKFSGPHGPDTFNRLFHGSLAVGVAVPSWAEPTPAEAILVPMSWAFCKYAEPDCADGKREWLDRAVQPVTECPDCGGALEGGRGWRESDVPTRVSTRTALANGVAKNEQLFSRRAVPATVRYAGRLRLRGVNSSAEDPGVAWLLDEKEIFVGGQLSTMGRCRWTATMATEPAPTVPVADLVLTLRSPAILVDAAGLPLLDLRRAIDDTVTNAGGKAKVVKTWTRSDVVGGWNSFAGIPKAEEWVLEAGSTALLGDVDEVARAALSDGLGLRRREGFGETTLAPLGDARPRLPDRPSPASGVLASGASAPAAAKSETAALADFVDSLDATTQRAALETARKVQRFRDSGLGPAIGPHLARTAELPWYRDLGPETQAELGKALHASDVRPLIALLLTRVRGRQT